mmetsp:Transcript_27764/g.30854  ORF Transcript_27764/g.30854 Transcript_27764/m.30854 type:complete len:311 (-) Transcript_27764:66-998(-)
MLVANYSSEEEEEITVAPPEPKTAKPKSKRKIDEISDTKQKVTFQVPIRNRKALHEASDEFHTEVAKRPSKKAKTSLLSMLPAPKNPSKKKESKFYSKEDEDEANATTSIPDEVQQPSKPTGLRKPNLGPELGTDVGPAASGASVGPAKPPHLAAQASVGPAKPPHLNSGASVGPSKPPHLTGAQPSYNQAQYDQYAQYAQYEAQRQRAVQASNGNLPPREFMGIDDSMLQTVDANSRLDPNWRINNMDNKGSYVPKGVFAVGSQKNKMIKRYGSLTALAADARARQPELDQRRASGIQTKRQTWGKYGW